jgi:hypothetical protein
MSRALGKRPHGVNLREAILLVACLSLAVSRQQAQGAGNGVTHLRVTGQVALPGVTRLGMNLGGQNYYDSGQMLKNLLYRNPGFEGMSYRTIFHCQFGGQSRCVDTWGVNFPADFWDGAHYEVLVGAAAGRHGTVTASAPVSGGYGFALDSSGPAIAVDDWIEVDKQIPGDPTAGWWPSVHGSGKLEAERADLPPGTAGKQALRMEATGPGASAQVNSYFDTTDGMTFVRLHGRYRLSFRAKALAGTKVLHVHVGRLAAGLHFYLDQDVPLTTSWANYNEEFTANESDLPAGSVEVSLNATGSSLLLDDLDLEQIGGDAANHTIFRDEVMRALKELHPGVLRLMQSYSGLGSTVDNMLATPLAMQRSGYRSWYDRVEDIPIGIPDFLELCQAIGAEPWIVAPTAMSLDEAKELTEFLAGGPETRGGVIRLARGRREPWTQAFRTIHIELGNETWNNSFQGEAIEEPTAYGKRANAVFTAIRAVAGRDAGRFDLVVGTQAAWAGRNAAILSAAPQANSLAIAPYLMSGISQWANDDQLYGPLLAQAEQMSREGIVESAVASASGRQLAVYEVNMGTVENSTPQDVLDRFIPSEAAGLAVTGHMLRMMRDHSIRDQMFFTLAQNQFRRPDGKIARMWGAVVAMGANERRRPQFVAESLANRVIRGNLMRVDVSGENPTHDQPPGNDSVHLNGVHEIDSYAFQDGNWHGMIVLNYGLHQPRRISIEAPGLSANSNLKIAKISTNPGDTNENSVKVQIQEGQMRGTDLVLAPCSMAVLEWAN